MDRYRRDDVVTAYAHPGADLPPFWRRCKTRHLPRTPARCKHVRGHDGKCHFGWYPENPPPHWRGQVCNLDAELPRVIYERDSQ